MNLKIHQFVLYGNFIFNLYLITFGFYTLIYNKEDLSQYLKKDAFIFGYVVVNLSTLYLGFILFYFNKWIRNEINNGIQQLEKRLIFFYLMNFIFAICFFIQNSSYDVLKNIDDDKKYRLLEIYFYNLFGYFIYYLSIIGLFVLKILLILGFYCLSAYFSNNSQEQHREQPINIQVIVENQPSAPPEIETNSLATNSENLCSICMKNEINQYLACSHSLCKECFERIKNLNNKCPFCRKSFA